MKEPRIIVLIGAGGVGKTSCATGLGIAAAQSGCKVGLLSIDPARRLAEALGLPLGVKPKRLDLPFKVKTTGELSAAMLDQKAVFDSMVRQHAKDERQAQKILDHQLYSAASSRLAGAVEYMALIVLQEMYDSGNYDTIILDTPPAVNTLDFLRKPNVLADFMEKDVMRWLVRPYILATRFGVDRLFAAGEKLMGGIAQVTGLSALRSVAELMVLLQEVIHGFHDSGQRILSLLHSEKTKFVLVSNFSGFLRRLDQSFYSSLKELDYHLDAVIWNRALPSRVSRVLDTVKSHEQFQAFDEPLSIVKRYLAEYECQKQRVHPWQKSQLVDPKTIIVQEQSLDLHTPDDMVNFSEHFSALSRHLLG